MSSIYFMQDGRIVERPLCTTLSTGSEVGVADPPADLPDRLADIAATAARCAPHLRVAVVPRLFTSYDEDYANFMRLKAGNLLPVGGVAYWSRRCVEIAWNGASSAVHHELWHALEPDLRSVDLVFVDDSVAVSGDKVVGDAYWDSRVERRARAYERWAAERDGGRDVRRFLGRPVRRIDCIYDYVYSGRLAGDIKRRRRARRQVPRWWWLAVFFEWPLPLVYVLFALLLLTRR